MKKENLNENITDNTSVENTEKISEEVEGASQAENEENKVVEASETVEENSEAKTDGVDGDGKGKKKKKEHSNAFKMFRILLVIVLAFGVYLLVSGAWNPFMDRELEPEAKKNYETSMELPEEMWNEMFPEYLEMEKSTTEYKEFDAAYGPYSDTPYGFEILEDNGKEGKNGILKSMRTAASSFNKKYGLDYEVYYMKNENYAKEEYSALVSDEKMYSTYMHKYKFSSGECTFSIRENIVKEGDYVFIIVKKGSTVYSMYGLGINYSKMQALFDKLNIDFKLPSMEELKTK